MGTGRFSALPSILRRHAGPLVVWVVALAVVVLMLGDRATVIEARGLVQGRQVTISPLEAGMLASVDVGLLQSVRRGQVVARLDEARLRADAAVVAAEVEAVRRELEHDLAGRQLNAASDQLRFASDVAASRLQVLEILAVLEPDRITLADLGRDVEGYRELLAQELVSVREYERVQAEHDALARSVAEHEALLARAQQDLAAAERRAEAAEGRADMTPGVEPELAAARVLAARVTALERQLDAVRVRAEDLQLVAPFDAVVTQIPASPGQMVRPGDTVLTLAESRPEQIVVWVDEESARRLQDRGDLEAMVIRNVGGRQVHARCPVGRVGVTVETMPPELWPAANLPQRGRPVVLAVPPELHVVPGELVTVRWG